MLTGDNMIIFEQYERICIQRQLSVIYNSRTLIT
jgi:hypothetical protein